MRSEAPGRELRGKGRSYKDEAQSSLSRKCLYEPAVVRFSIANTDSEKCWFREHSPLWFLPRMRKPWLLTKEVDSRIERRASWTSLGCYTDNVSGRALPNQEFVSGGAGAMTNKACQAACLAANYKFAGTEYAGECCRFELLRPTGANQITDPTPWP